MHNFHPGKYQIAKKNEKIWMKLKKTSLFPLNQKLRERIWVFASNSNVLLTISFQPNGMNIENILNLDNIIQSNS